MVRVIMGVKGSGKTKRLVEMVNLAVAEDHGDVVVIEKEKKLIYDIPYKARLINASEYDFKSGEFFKGFLSGLYAGNYDITHVFIDNFLKILKNLQESEIEALLDWLSKFCEGKDITFTISVSSDPSKSGSFYEKYIV